MTGRAVTWRHRVDASELSVLRQSWQNGKWQSDAGLPCRLARCGGTRWGNTMGEHNGAALDVARMVRHAAEGDPLAWQRLVEQYARLVWATTRDFKLAESDAADVVQMTWLRLLENIDRIESPAHVGSWLVTTARRECLRVLAARKKVVPVKDDDFVLNGVAAQEPAIDERLLAEDVAREVREAVSRLPGHWQRLLELLMADPPVSYSEISDQLGLPVGSIGPTRARCLTRLRALLQAS